MKKILFIIFLLVIVFFIVINLAPNTMDTDGLATNTTYLEDSNELVSNMEIVGSLKKKKRLQIKTIFHENNHIKIKDLASDSEIEVIITDDNGKEIQSEVVQGQGDIVFESELREGMIQLLLSPGEHETTININEEIGHD